MSSIAGNLQRLRARIAAACAAAGRDPRGVTLVAVGKGFPADVLAAAYEAGQRDFGESYVQEALPKIGRLPGAVWHFIGPLQSNKTREVAEHFAWVHGVDREKIARRLSEQRPAQLPPLNVCVQVNISGEASKAGVPPATAADLCRAVAALPRVKLRGLMAIPAPGGGREPYRKLRELLASMGQLGLDTLSAGMSDDLEDAIAEGSTMVRIGTAIFGAREKK